MSRVPGASECVCCECCDRPLMRDPVQLAYNGRTNTWHRPGEVPDEDSQGLFYFGPTCAQKVLSA